MKKLLAKTIDIWNINHWLLEYLDIQFLYASFCRNVTEYDYLSSLQIIPYTFYNISCETGTKR